MVLINSTTMQATAKIVYYGPGLCGKTTNLQHVHSKTAPGSRGEMVSLETETDRTLFFDLLPLEVGIVGGMKIRLQLYTVPGQVFYNATRRMVLKGADGIVFVADSQPEALEANLESLANLRDNLRELGQELEDVPLVLQYNKRDLRQILPVETLQKELNAAGAPHFEASARFGVGVFETLKGISRLSLTALRRRLAETGEKPRAETGAKKRLSEDTKPGSVKEVDFAEENTGKYAVRAVPVKEGPALHAEIEQLREGQLEVSHHAAVELPEALLKEARRIGIHLTFQGERLSLRDVTTVQLDPASPRERIRLQLDIEISPKKI